jgi:adenylate cyclase
VKALRKALGYPPVGCAVISLIVLGALLGLRARGLLQRPELIFYDFFVRQRAQDKMAADSRIVICGMTEADLVKYGHPLDDAKLATLLEKIAAAGPCVVGLDIYRDLKEPRSGEHYPELAKALLRLDNVIAIERISTIKPPPVLQDQLDRVAPNNFPFDLQVDGVCRRAYLIFESDVSQPRESFALALAHTYLAAHNIDVRMVDAPGGGDPLLRLGKTTFPRLTPDAGGYHGLTDGLTVLDYEFLADYRSSQNYRTISFSDILENPPFADALKDAIVIVGVMTPSVKDYNPTPVDPVLRGPVHHAMIVDQLLRSALRGESPTGWLPEAAEIAWIGLCTLVGGILGLVLRSPWRLAPALALLIGAIIGAGWEALLHALWIPTITPALGAFVAATFVTSLVVFLEHSDRQVLRTLFSRHVSKEVLDVLWAEREQLLDGGRLKPHRVTATVLFTDLKDYATIAEHMDPPDLMNWVNEHTSRIAPLVESHGGIVNSYGGDAVMAVFGAPVPHTNEKDIDRDAIRAVECALAIREALKELNCGWASRGMPTVSMRVGIYTGPVVTGSIGSMNRLEYTALGDTTNTAARLQSLGKELSNDDAAAACTILIGDSTWQRLRGRFTTQCLGAKRLKGKSNEVIVHSVLSASPQPISP